MNLTEQILIKCNFFFDIVIKRVKCLADDRYYADAVHDLITHIIKIKMRIADV